jgi:single-strand DNA-binding protein
VNSISLIGRLGRDPEVRFTSTGKAVANFTIAVDEKWGDQKQTHWFKVVAWEKSAEFAQKYFAKGSKIGITGRLAQRKWVDKDNNNRESIEIIAERFDFAGEKKDASPKGDAFEGDDAPESEFDA